MTTPPEEEHDEDYTPVVPEPPRRVPFGVAVATGFLGLLAILLTIGATATLTASGLYEDTIGEAAAEGLGTVLIAVSAVLVAASAWSFARNGNTVGPMVVGGLTLLAGLICLIQGVMTDTDAEGVRVGVVALAIGLGITLPPLAGQSPLYLAARRVWAKAEKEWLRDLATSDSPPPVPHQPWTPYGAPQQQAWPYQPHPGPQPHHQPWPGPHAAPVPYPPQPQQAQPWQGHQPPPYQPQPQPHQGQTWTQPAPGPVWPAEAAPASAPPAEAPQVPHSGPPHAAAQHAPTEYVRTTTEPAPASDTAPTPDSGPPPR